MDDRALEQLPEWARQTLAWLGGCCAVLALIWIFWMSWDEIVRLRRERYVAEDHAKAIWCLSRGGTVIENQGGRYNGCQIHGREVPNRCWPIGLC